MKKIICCLLVASVLCGCDDDDNEDVVKQPDKDGSIETVLSVQHADSVDVLTTTYKIWVKGNLVKTIVKTDTLSSLGMEEVDVEDSSGNKRHDKVQKDYEFYITVK